MAEIYDTIGKSYMSGRRTDSKIAEQVHSHLSNAESILNIGAGTGSYEPAGVDLIAVEPSQIMIEQRPIGSAPVIQASAENLPFEDGRFSHCMTVLSMHHWTDRAKAFNEIKRVTREKFIALTWMPSTDKEPYWLYRDYLKKIPEMNRSIFPSFQELSEYFSNIQEFILPIPYDCQDGFDGAYWQRPEAFLDSEVRKNMSVFSKIPNANQILEKLEKDLASGEWNKRNAELLDKRSLDCGYRIVVADLI